MKILLSIKPKYAEKILAGDKLFEYRKIIPKTKKIKTVVIYATKPIGKIVGEFTIDQILSDTPDKLWICTSTYAGLSQATFDNYFKDQKKAFAIKIKSVKRYPNPLDLETLLGKKRPPQSFYYLP